MRRFSIVGRALLPNESDRPAWAFWRMSFLQNIDTLAYMNRSVSHPSHVAFDFDGTLADSPHLVVELYNDVARRRGYGELTPENLMHLRGLGVHERARALGVHAYRLPALMLEVARAYRAVTAQVALYPGVPTLLDDLAERGTRLFVLSTNREDNIRLILRRAGLEDRIEGVYASHRLFGKAQLLRRLLSREGIARERLTYVGDEQRDIDACREVGVRVVAVAWGIDTIGRLQASNPDLLASTPADIARFLGVSDPRQSQD